jgi:hypothetical protein
LKYVGAVSAICDFEAVYLVVYGANFVELLYSLNVFINECEYADFPLN